MTNETKSLLRLYAEKFETPSFIENDPSQFMHQVRGAKNKEATAFVASSLSFGSRAQFIEKIKWIIERADNDVDNWIRSGKFKNDFHQDNDKCFYRFFTHSTMYAFLCRYKRIMDDYGSLGNFVKRNCSNDALEAVAKICQYFNEGGTSNVIPLSHRSACKRLCMFLRWMVRDNSPVDIGLWSRFIDKKTLVIPLDTHVLRQAGKLGLMKSSASSMAAAKLLTAKLSEVFPDDPVRGDFALFGLGVNSQN
ncbi:MAG: TIGR02757 family protein [Kiritimatiellae bacterium]|nr:TIGR02757 family protein [Kiritimatiellia bacterium]